MAEQDYASVRTVVRDLQHTAEAMTKRYPDSIDVRRFAADARRLEEDLNLIDPPKPEVEKPMLQVIADREYPPDFWQDAGDEGLGQHSTPAGPISSKPRRR